MKSAYMRGIPGAVSNATESPVHDNIARPLESHADSDYDDDIDGVPRKRLCIAKEIPINYIALARPHFLI